ncbi:hypothetical protein PanWU01x14_151820 [Parasponia andersonii]|uniref:Uncharacterized protein n=1 Tax=Parasponia andersonii TaxID=3476 RepID=A0A2P5CHN8_PARAD|nr:hypothetical protein PanWU01x14_151820 [Parasponia andersonii]
MKRGRRTKELGGLIREYVQLSERGTPRDFDNWQSQTLWECLDLTWELSLFVCDLPFSSYDSRVTTPWLS